MVFARAQRAVAGAVPSAGGRSSGRNAFRAKRIFLINIRRAPKNNQAITHKDNRLIEEENE